LPEVSVSDSLPARDEKRRDMQPTISIIIATYKRPHLIVRALDSVAAQSLSPYEIIVVDDASGDDTGEIVSAWSRRNGIPVLFIQQQENLGVGAARNAALKQATGILIGFLDSDDAYLPHALETLSAPFLVHQETVLSFADAMQYWDDGRPPIPMMRRCLDSDRDTAPLVSAHPGWRRMNDPQSLLLTTSMIPTCAALFRRAVTVTVGMMPEYRYGEDWIFWLKLAAQGDFLCQFVDVAQIYRQGDNQTGQEHDARNARLSLNAMLGLLDGHFGVELSKTNHQRLKQAIVEKAGHMRYHGSKRGLARYWRLLGSAEATATGGRWKHLLNDPKSILRAMFSRV
jgi:glycosyltransferase involved in cell wall biosynthesis